MGINAATKTLTCKWAGGVNGLGQSGERQEKSQGLENDICDFGAHVLCLQAGGYKFKECFWTTSAASVTEGPAFSTTDIQKHDRRRPEETDYHGQPRRDATTRSCEDHTNTSRPFIPGFSRQCYFGELAHTALISATFSF